MCYLSETFFPPPSLKGWISPFGPYPIFYRASPPASYPDPLLRLKGWILPYDHTQTGQYYQLGNFPVCQVAGQYVHLAGWELFHQSCWEWETDKFFPAMFQMLKIASESFIPALLLFLGLFLKIELSAPVPHQSLKTGCCREVILVVRDAL